MQIDVFSLLNDARQRIAANIAAAEARRDFWIASVDLSVATIGGGGGGGAETPSATTSPAGTEFEGART
jgi:outer membrane protein TolC